MRGWQIRSAETSPLRTVVTDDSGQFDATSLAVGAYEVTASKAGFRTSVRVAITLVIGQQAEISLTLQVGDVQQTVEVPANLALVVFRQTMSPASLANAK